MTPRASRRGDLGRRSAFALLVVACAVPPGSAFATTTRPSDGTLAPRLAELAEPAVRAASPARQAAKLGLAASGPGSLVRDGGRVVVDVRFEAGAIAAVPALRAAGAEIVHASRALQIVTVAARPASLPRIAEVPGVGGVSEVLAPIVSASCQGAVVSEGDGHLGAASARAAFGVDGSGVTVGILSDSFDRDPTAPTHAADDVASGDLPGPGSPCGSGSPVALVDDSKAGSDEGRAMAQIVHDLAPGASIGFATALPSETKFAANIRALAAAGAGVIADDVVYFEEPFFQDGPVAVAVNEVVGKGVSFFSAAGNSNIRVGDKDTGSWEAPAFRDASVAVPPAACPAGVPAYAIRCMDFNPAAGTTDTGFSIVVGADETLIVDLQWAQPWNGVTTDLDAYLVSAGDLLTPNAGNETQNVASKQKPVEVLSWENKTATPRTVQLAISRCDSVCDLVNGGDGASPRLKFVLFGNDVAPAEYFESSAGDTVGPTIFGHAGAEGAIATAAVRYNTTSAPEPFSSRGPVRHEFGPVLSAAPAAPLSPPREIPKPDLATTDGGANTFFGAPVLGVWRFFGTSAAAPHAAAVAALLRQANPGASNAQLRTFLATTARPVGTFGPNAVGAGLIDASAAVLNVALPPIVRITKAPEPLSRNPLPAVEFTANRPVTFSCQVDGGTPQPCASPFTVPAPLADGRHGIAVSGVDAAGRVGSGGSVSFAIDTKAPSTRIVKHPPKLIVTERRAVRGAFRFRSNEAGVTFACKVDRRPPRLCGGRMSRRFGIGRHTVKVRARDMAGNVDRTPAVFRFRVRRVG
jgi:Subtilase family